MLYFCLVKLLIEKSISKWHIKNNFRSLFFFMGYKIIKEFMLISFNSYQLQMKPVQFVV